MNKYFISSILVFSMIFSLLVLSVRKVKALCSDLNAPYNYTYSTTLQFEGETLSQRIAKTASCELKSRKCMNAVTISQFCGLYGGYYWPYFRTSSYGLGGYGGLYGG